MSKVNNQFERLKKLILEEAEASSIPVEIVEAPIVKPKKVNSPVNLKAILVAGSLALSMVGVGLMLINKQEIPISSCPALTSDQVEAIKALPTNSTLSKEQVIQSLGEVGQGCSVGQIPIRKSSDGPVILSRTVYGLPPGTYGTANELILAFEGTQNSGQKFIGFRFASPSDELNYDPNFPEVAYRGPALGANIGDLTVAVPLGFQGLQGLSAVRAVGSATVIAHPTNKNIAAVVLDDIPGYMIVFGNVKDNKDRRVKEGETLLEFNSNVFTIGVISDTGQVVAASDEIIAIILNQPIGGMNAQ